MNNDRNPNVKNNTPRPDGRPAQRPNGAQARPVNQQTRPSAPAQRPAAQNPANANRPNVNLSGSLNTGNFRVQNTGNFRAQNTGNLKAQNTGNFKAQSTGNFRTAPQGERRPMVEDESVRRREPRPEPRPEPRRIENSRSTPHRTRDDYLVWFLILSIILLVALIATFLIIKFTDPADQSGAKLPNGENSIQAGVNPDNDETTVPEWAVVPSNLKAFVPKTVDSTKKISSSSIHSATAIMVDLKTGEVVAECLPDEIVYPASLTKIMTAIVACELITDMYDTFTLTNEIINPLVQEGASRANFSTSHPITMKDLIYGVILPSGADACAALAIKLCGSEEAFVEKMNEKAAAIGCEKTNFVNSTGLHDERHYSTARDMANILSYAMQNPFLRAVLSAESYKTRAPMGNDRDGYYYTMYCIWAARYAGNESSNGEMFAAKTGYTPEAGQCLASVTKTAVGDEYVIVTIGARSINGEDSKPKPYKDAKYMMDTYVQ